MGKRRPPDEPEYDYPDELPRSTVVLTCNSQHVAADDVAFLDVAEDAQGRDVMTFTCPKCQEVHKSLIYG